MNVKNEPRTKVMSISAIIISFLFFFNANIYVIDILPDIIGYIIISIALVKLADLSEEISVSLRFFRYMIIVEIAKVIALLCVLGFKSQSETDTGTLLIAFSFAVIDAIILFVAYTKLFSGLISLGFAHKNTAVLGARRAGGRSYTERIRSFTLFFVIFKAAMSVLPEFSNLAAYEYDESSGIVDLYEYIGLMRGMSFVIVTVVGIVWLVRVIRYFVRLGQDREFLVSLSSAYNENVLPKRGIFIKRRLQTAFFFFTSASVFTLDFRIEDINVISDAVGAVLLLVGILICSKYLSVKKPLVWSAGIFYFIAALAAYIAEISFYLNGYNLSSIYRRQEIYEAYVLMSTASVVQTVSFLLMVAVIIYCMRDIIKNHTGFVYGNDAERDRERLRIYHKSSQKKLWFVGISAVILAASDILYVFLAAKFVYAGFICVVATAIFFISVLRTTNELLDEIDTKYMLD